MSVSSCGKLYSLAMSMMNKTNPYTRPVEDLKYTYFEDGTEETKDFCKMLQRSLIPEKYESGRTSSYVNNCRKCIEHIEAVMIEYLQDFPGAYSIVQHHRNIFGTWIQDIVFQYGQGMNYDLPTELQYESENQDTAVLLLKELQNRNGVTKRELREKLRLKSRQIFKDLRKLDHSLIGNTEQADMSDYIPFRIGGQPVKVRISVEGNPDKPGDRSLYYKTVNSLHPVILQENLMQVYTLIQALCRNYYDNNSSVSLYIAVDIWYQLSSYAKGRIRLISVNDDDMQSFIDIMDGDFPAGNCSIYMTEREMYHTGDLSDEEILMYFVKAPDRRCNITIRDGSHANRILSDQSLSARQDENGNLIFIAAGRDGSEVCFSKTDFSDIEECRNHAGSQKNTDGTVDLT